MRASRKTFSVSGQDEQAMEADGEFQDVDLPENLKRPSRSS
jgi:hypothetical protein